MKRFAACALAFALLAMCGLAVAGPYSPPKQWDDLSWWGKSGATPAPVKDAKVNAYWWWPTEPASNADDQELWGNRGKVLHNVLAEETVTPPPPDVAPPPPADKVKIPLFNNVLFDFNKSFLRPEGKQEVDKVVQFMKDHPEATATVSGHASNEGTDAYNVALGQRRADAVRDYMVQQGIAPERLQAVSKGESEPAVPNDSEPNRKLNRRAVFDIALPGAEPAA
ncbi:MAG: OmpA family protein [FCB group bacterium]|nr:OmpA family protein [FCB group bacterium]